jgi:hypothetical protein
MLLFARVEDALHKPEAAAAYKAFLALTPAGLPVKDEDPLAKEARKRLSSLK